MEIFNYEKIKNKINYIINSIKQETSFDEMIALKNQYNNARAIIKEACEKEIYDFPPKNVDTLEEMRSLLTVILQYESIDLIATKKLEGLNNYTPYSIFDNCLSIAQKKYGDELFHEYNGIFNPNEYALSTTDIIGTIGTISFKIIFSFDFSALFDTFFKKISNSNSIIVNFSLERINKIKDFYLTYTLSLDITKENRVKILIYNYKLFLNCLLYKTKKIIKNNYHIMKENPKTTLGIAGGFIGAGILSTEMYQNLVNEFLNEHPILNTIIGPILRNPKSSIILGSLGTYLISKGFPELAKLWNKKITDKENEIKEINELSLSSNVNNINNNI